MSRSYSEVFLEAMLERRRLLREWRRLVEGVARVAREAYPGARVYLAGSVARGEWIASSDIDVVIVLDHEPSAGEAARLISLVWERLSLPPLHPLEIHVVGPRSFEAYRRRGPLKPVEPGEAPP